MSASLCNTFMFYDEKFALLLQCKLQLFSKHKKGNLYIEFEVNFVVEVPLCFGTVSWSGSTMR